MLSELLKAVNANSGAINLLFSLVVAGATVFYAKLTHKLVSETTRMREVQTEPALAIWIEPSEHGLNFINLIIENSGQGAAQNVTLKANPDFQRFQNKFISDLGLFKHGIKRLAPGQRISFFLTSILDGVHGKEGELSRLDFAIEATYQSALGKAYKDTFPIHFESFEGYGTIGTPPLISIARDLGKLQADLGRVTSGFNRLQVAVHTQEDVERENEEMRARFESDRAELEAANREVVPTGSPPMTALALPADIESNPAGDPVNVNNMDPDRAI